jgi:hypothetical protein
VLSPRRVGAFTVRVATKPTVGSSNCLWRKAVTIIPTREICQLSYGMELSFALPNRRATLIVLWEKAFRVSFYVRLRNLKDQFGRNTFAPHYLTFKVGRFIAPHPRERIGLMNITRSCASTAARCAWYTTCSGAVCAQRQQHLVVDDLGAERQVRARARRPGKKRTAGDVELLRGVLRVSACTPESTARSISVPARVR